MVFRTQILQVQLVWVLYYIMVDDCHIGVLQQSKSAAFALTQKSCVYTQDLLRGRNLYLAHASLGHSIGHLLPWQPDHSQSCTIQGMKI